MKKQLITTLVTAALLTSTMAPTAYANQPDLQTADETYVVGEQEQFIGLGSGAAVGALVGGPVGAIIGAMVGGIIGTAVGQDEQIKSQNEDMVELTARNTELERMDINYNQAQIEIARLQQNLQLQSEERQALLLEVNVHFRTGSSDIEPLFQQQLDEIAGLMKQSPEMSWQLAGYADRRGDSQKNFDLSMRRVDAVRDYLESRGIDSDQFIIDAYGDLEPLKSEQNFESDFFDRRVTLRSTQNDVYTAHTYP
jgi:sortase system peptidoglycan-associated protein